jgi:hypothetical protein
MALLFRPLFSASENQVLAEIGVPAVNESTYWPAHQSEKTGHRVSFAAL